MKFKTEVFTLLFASNLLAWWLITDRGPIGCPTVPGEAHESRDSLDDGHRTWINRHVCVRSLHQTWRESPFDAAAAAAADDAAAAAVADDAADDDDVDNDFK